MLDHSNNFDNAAPVSFIDELDQVDKLLFVLGESFVAEDPDRYYMVTLIREKLKSAESKLRTSPRE